MATCSLGGVATEDTPEVLSIEGREVSVTHPRKPYFSNLLLERDEALEDRTRPLLPLGRGGRARRYSGSTDRAQALRRWRRGAAVLSKARAGETTHLAPHGGPLFSVRTNGRRGGGRRCGGSRLDRQPGVHRAPSPPCAVRRSRPPGRASGRPLSGARRGVGRRSPRSPGGERSHSRSCFTLIMTRLFGS